MTDDERRSLTDNQIIKRFVDTDQARSAISKEVDEHYKLIAELKDELQYHIQSVTDSLATSQKDRDEIRAEITRNQRETRRHLQGLGDCVNEIKAWQYDYNRRKELDQEHRAERETRQDKLEKEIIAEFQFRKRFNRVVWGSLAVIIPVVVSILAGIGHIRDLFTHNSP